MAISLVTGPLGTGKSFYAIRKAVDSLESGKVVITNFPMSPDWTDRVVDRHPVRWVIPGRRRKLKAKWRASTMVVPDIATLVRIRLKGVGEGRGVVILDEVHRWMNSRTWKDEDRLKIVEWFSLSRKLGFDVYLITQDSKNVDRQVRDLFEYHIQLANIKRFKVLGIPVMPFNLFLAIWQWHGAGKAIVKRECYRLNWTKSLYDTMGVSAFGLDREPDDVIRLPRPLLPAPSPTTASASATSAEGAAAPRRADDELRRRRLVQLGHDISGKDVD
jgi:adenosyl cobinamide kinase/adenosyl cobinamide phosphate guanylyltransferase